MRLKCFKPSKWSRFDVNNAAEEVIFTANAVWVWCDCSYSLGTFLFLDEIPAWPFFGKPFFGTRQYCSALYCRGRLASWCCPHFETSTINVNWTSLGTPVCRCRTKMCSKIGSSLSLSQQKTKFYRTLSSNEWKRKFSSAMLSVLSARSALIYKQCTTCLEQSVNEH